MKMSSNGDKRMNIRSPAVAGLFYDRDPARLSDQLTAMLGAAGRTGGERPCALVVPHAGYAYSGATAARAYARLAPWADEIRRVVLFGPAHRVALAGMAVPAADAFETPLGIVRLDRPLIERALAQEGVVVSDEAHRLEHSLEVQLPFLQAVLGDFTLAPLVVGRCPAPVAAAVIDALWGGPETLVVISTDLSHYHPYDRARAQDLRTCQRILARDGTLSGLDACGAHALNGLLASEHGGNAQLELLDLRNSGDTAGDRDRVVGYGAFLLH